jgi:LAS superfamily LD-carboxypeptidase LdcB
MENGAQILVEDDNNSHLLRECDVFGVNDRGFVSYSSAAIKLHPQVVPALSALVLKASQAGFDLRVASGFRSFERQLHIWNQKACGQRPVLDEREQPVDLNALSDAEKVFAILRWSALPGASRHHWGSDMDVYDAAHMPADYQLQLSLNETQGDGCCADFHRWLTQELAQQQAFFRPYVAGVGRISPEPWHLSYAPLAGIFAAQLTEERLRNQLQASDIALKDSVLSNLTEIFNHYIKPYQG